MNKNRKGFTLVELIVVVTIFGVILGAILNMIKPANNTYRQKTASSSGFFHTFTFLSNKPYYLKFGGQKSCPPTHFYHYSIKEN